MITVSCSNLESVRQNPMGYAQQLLSGKKSGGRKGMLKCWQMKAKSLHVGELDLPKAIHGLQQNFMEFAYNSKNKKRQEFLLDRLTPYWEEVKKREFKYISSQKQVKWDIIQNVTLTGNTPITVLSPRGYVAYFYTENPISWQMQLKFPLLQFYLAKHICNCDVSELKIGTYCLKSMTFDLITYNSEELEQSISETEDIFKRVNEYYNNRPLK